MALEPAMRKMSWQRQGLLLALALFAILLGFPFTSNASLSLKADEMCVPVIEACGCMTVPCKGGCCGGLNMHLCACWDTPPGGKVTGICVHNLDCKGTGTEKGGLGDAKSMMDILKSIMDALKKKGGGGGGDSGQFGTTTCTSYYQVSLPSSDPCAYYVPPVSNTLFDGSASGTDSSASTELLNALNSGIDSAFGVGSPIGIIPNANVTSTPEVTSGQSLSEQAVDVGRGQSPEGAYGDIVTTDTGGTIYASSRDVESNVEVSGFFGADTFLGQIQSAVANMCQARPWAGALISRLIPETFFDGLCSWRGYQVGTPAPPTPLSPTPLAEPKGKKATTTPASPQTPTTGKPKVDIWAVPESVSLGFRASIFWNTKNVDSCAISSSGGNFNESKLSGGAATVPLTNDTTFTVSCTTTDGKTLTDRVTVTISP